MHDHFQTNLWNFNASEKYQIKSCGRLRQSIQELWISNIKYFYVHIPLLDIKKVKNCNKWK